MFICAVAFPWYNANKQCEFNIRIGCWLLVEYKEAQRKSKNRPAGVLEMKPLTKINADVIRTYMCKKIIPRIKKVWPQDMKKECKVQWDNAKVHVTAYDMSLLECLTSGGWNIDVAM